MIDAGQPGSKRVNFLKSEADHADDKKLSA